MTTGRNDVIVVGFPPPEAKTMHILVGATGSVACIKLPNLIRELKVLKDVSYTLCIFTRITDVATR